MSDSAQWIASQGHSGEAAGTVLMVVEARELVIGRDRLMGHVVHAVAVDEYMDQCRVTLFIEGDSDEVDAYDGTYGEVMVPPGTMIPVVRESAAE